MRALVPFLNDGFVRRRTFRDDHSTQCIYLPSSVPPTKNKFQLLSRFSPREIQLQLSSDVLVQEAKSILKLS